MPKPMSNEATERRNSEERLWDRFQHRPTDQNAEALVEWYIPLVCRVVRQMAVYTPPHMDMDDLMQHALMGLWVAIGRYDRTQGIPFEAYALRRIRGAARDALRAQDPLTRTDRTSLKKIDEAARDFVMENGRGPSEDELAQAVGIDLEKMQSLLLRAQPWMSLDAMMEVEGGVDRLPDPRSPDPRKETILHEQATRFRAAFRKLQPRQQKILYLYYYEDLTLKEIAAIFEISEARVCQLHSAILVVLRALIQEGA